MQKDSVWTPEAKTQWLRGTTCRRHGKCISTLGDKDRFWLMKHMGHSESCGGVFRQILWCETYYALYDTHVSAHIGWPFGRDSCLRLWKGRWKKAYDAEVQELIKKDLQSSPTVV